MSSGGLRSLIGRATELETLLALAAEAADGRGRLVVVRGEAGIGKTRLLSEFASRAPLAVVWGRCWEAGGAPALWPWQQVLRRVARIPGVCADPTAAAELGTVDEAGGGQFRRLQVFEALVDRLASVAAQAPLAVILDDLHVADQASLELLTFLAEDLERLPLLVVSVGRDEPAGGDRITAALRPVRGQAVTLALGGLPRAQISELVTSSQHGGSDGLVDSLLELTAGNPLFIEELLHWLAGRPPGVAVRERAVLPPALQDVIVQRLTHLAPRTVDVLEVASVLGRRGDVDLVAELGGWPSGTVRDALREAERHAVVVPDGSSSQMVAFRHGLLREVVHQAIEPRRREQLHLQAAQVLSSKPDVQVGAIAMHLLAAGDLPARHDVRAACERAAEVASAAFAYAEAAELYRAALERADSNTERARLGADLGVALHSAGQGDEARLAFLTATELAHAERYPALLARCALGYGVDEWITLTGGPDAKHIAVLQDARRLVGDSDQVLATQLDARLVVARFDGQPTADISAAAEAVLRRARVLGDPVTQQYALLARRTVSRTIEVDLRVALQDELRETASVTGDLDTLLRVVHWQLATALETGDVSRTLECAGEAEALAERAKRPLYRSWAHRSRAMWALLAGRFEEAEAETAAAFEVNAHGSDPVITQTYGAQLLQLRYEQGRSAELLPLLDDLVERHPLAPVWRCARAKQLLATGARERAVGDYEAIVAAGIGAFARDYTRVVSVVLAAEVCVELGDEAFAQVLYDELLPHAGRATVAGFAAVLCFGAVDLFLGMLADVLGREDAEQHFQVAADLNRRLGARPWSARTRLHHARYLLRRHADRQADALALLRSAEQEADELGAVALARAVAHTLEAASTSVRLTVVFTDIEGSTGLVDRIGDAAWRPVQAAHARLVRACIADHDGEERQHLGDGFLLVFRSPANAVAFGRDLQRRNATQDVDVPIRVRVGMHTSDIGRGPDGLFGLGVHIASRVCSLARGDEILVSAQTAEAAGLVPESLGPERVETLRGIAQPTRLAAVRWQLSALPPIGRSARAARG